MCVMAATEHVSLRHPPFPLVGAHDLHRCVRPDSSAGGQPPCTGSGRFGNPTVRPCLFSGR